MLCRMCMCHVCLPLPSCATLPASVAQAVPLASFQRHHHDMMLEGTAAVLAQHEVDTAILVHNTLCTMHSPVASLYCPPQHAVLCATCAVNVIAELICAVPCMHMDLRCA
jgi:hypothetical protein